MKLTCVTAVFNAVKSGNRERLIRCAESVAKLKTEHEHLIYDGASTDGTVELLRELEARIHDLKVVSEPDTGIYNALNKGVRDAKGEWFYVLGCDDYIAKPEVLDALLSEPNDGFQAIATTVMYEAADGTKMPSFVQQSDLRKMFLWSVCCHQGRIGRTSMIRKYHGFDERYKIAADTNLLILAHYNNERYRYVYRDFAVFTKGGTAQLNIDLACREDAECVERILELSPRQILYHRRTGLVPLTVSIRLLFHGNMAIRMAARDTIWLLLKNILRPFYRPVMRLLRKGTKV